MNNWQFVKQKRLGLTILVVLFVAIGARSQTTEEPFISLNLDNVQLTEVFKAIEAQSDYHFNYSDDIQENKEAFTYNISEQALTVFLEQLAQDANISYKVNEKVISIKKLPRIKITGTVIDADTKEMLIGTTVRLKGSTIGAVTDIDGGFELDVDRKNPILIVSFIGYESQEVAINGQTTVTVELHPEEVFMEGIVVTALSLDRKKSSLGYSVTALDGDEMGKGNENNPINSLAGKVSGLQITKAPTGVDGSSRIVLRGVASISGNNRPLFVIDGIPMDASYGGAGRWGGRDGGDALSDLNSEDIESISVLKGAGAAAAYGSRGGNGVILITTKKGLKRKGLGITLSSNLSCENPIVTPDFQNEYGQGAFGSYPSLSGNPASPSKEYPWVWSFGPELDGSEITDWTGSAGNLNPQPNSYTDFFRTGISNSNTITINGGDEKSSVHTSFSNQISKGIVPNNDLNRFGINLRGTTNLSENLELDGKLSYTQTKVTNRPSLSESSSNIVQTLAVLPRNITLQSLKDNTVDSEGNLMTWINDYTFNNPYWILNNMHNEDVKYRLQSMFALNWNISPKVDLTARSGFDSYNKENYSWENPGYPNIEIGTGGMSQGMSRSMEWNSDFLATYKEKLQNVDFSLSFGGNHRFNESKSISSLGVTMNVPEFYNISNFETTKSYGSYYKKVVFSLYTLGQVSYKDYVYFDATFRNDWSSTLPTANNSYGYHSENLSFLFTEALGIKSSILDMGKLRASYAKVGNDTEPYQIDMYYTMEATSTDYTIASLGTQLPQYDLQPEETTSWEVGTNLSFFKKRIDIDFTYYNSISDNQIMPVSLPISTGFRTKKMNAGKVQNIGMELQINATPVATEKFSWDVVLNWSKNNSLVKELYGDMEYLVLAEDFGVTVQARPGQPYGIIYTTDYKRNKFGDKLIDSNGYAQAGDYKAMGDINPDWNGGLSNTLRYGNLSLNFLIDMQMGGDIYSWGKAYMGLFGTSAETLEGRKEWYSTHQADYTGEPDGFIETGINEKNGQQNSTPIQPLYRWYNLYNKEIGAEWMQDATNIRLREMVISFSLPDKWLKNNFISNASFSVFGRNLMFFYRAMEHFDPESGYSSGNVGNALEHFSLPSTRSYGANLKLTF